MTPSDGDGDAGGDLWGRRGPEAVLSVNRTLWGMVVPELRAVLVRLWPDLLEARWCFDLPVDEDIRELVSEAEAECWADFASPPDDWSVTYIPVHVPTGIPVHDALGDGWHTVYHRREMSWEQPGRRY